MIVIPELKLLLIVIIGWFSLFPAYGQTSFSRGEALFVQNKPQEALVFLEAAVNEDPAHVRAFIYLGIAYEQLNRVDEAIATYRKILPRGGSETASIAFNLGNAYLSQGNHPLAVQSYTQALVADPTYSAALLNRANTRIRLRAFEEAIADYQDYISLEPRSAQRSKIEQLIVFIREEQVAEERRIQEERVAEERRIQEERVAEERRIQEERIAEERRIVEEQAAAEQRRIAEERRIQEERAAEEQRRIAAEETARLEAERRQRLLEEVAASLHAAAEGSRGLSAGNETVEGYNGEFELE
jgi:lipopolysaccharide biosynthesis regulator YciM